MDNDNRPEEKCVWISHAGGSPDNKKIWHHPGRPDAKKSRLGKKMYEIGQRAERGERLDPSEIPDWFYEPRNRKPFSPPPTMPISCLMFFILFLRR